MNGRRGGISTSCSSEAPAPGEPLPPFHSWPQERRGGRGKGSGRGSGRGWRGRGTNASARGRFPRPGGVPLPPGRRGRRACEPRWAPSLPPFLLPSSLRPPLPPPTPPAPTAPRPRAPEGGGFPGASTATAAAAGSGRLTVRGGHGARGSPTSVAASRSTRRPPAVPNAHCSFGGVQPRDQLRTEQPRAAAATVQWRPLGCCGLPARRRCGRRGARSLLRGRPEF